MRAGQSQRILIQALALLVFIPFLPGTGNAERESRVELTKHNLSSTGPGPVKASDETQICVFCHTPHGATNAVAPLWNRELTDGYTTYVEGSFNIDSIDATIALEPGKSSKLCLSCHDGSIAIASVNVANGQLNPTIDMTGTGPSGRIPQGAGAQTGFTRELGVNLTNDHPISFTYDDVLAVQDGELRAPSAQTAVATRDHPGTKPLLPLEQGNVECITCHDPHIRDPSADHNIKFLRVNRFQTNSGPTGGSFVQDDDIICLACHDKLGTAWSQSAHADPTVADEVYTVASATLREFRTSPAPAVWEIACLNCHDTHSVQGSRRLLREGNDSVVSPKMDGKPAIEEVCYQCHSTSGQSILSDVSEVPNIKSDFSLLRHMPITSGTSGDQQTTPEVHNIENADFIETPSKLGKGIGNYANRHVECTDCHNPHRVAKNQLFNLTGGSAEGTHRHTSINQHDNIASGVLRGSWGVEPNYTDDGFHVLPGSYDVKQGDGGVSAATDVSNSYVTREYQICLKCHSDYGYDDDNVYPVGTRPDLGASGGGTPFGTNDLNQYTNQAREFQAPFAHRGDGQSVGESGGAHASWTTNNHRAWHPVMDNTGRTRADYRNWVTNSPWRINGVVGSQTMYCTDCHGSNTNAATTTPTGSNPWGPHGSTNNFLLKGGWSNSTNDICFKCHDSNYYNNANADENRSGFCCDGGKASHQHHRDKVGPLQCNWCHVAVPHGWKNKAFLVNLNDVGPEAGLAKGTQVRNGTTTKYTQGPYYMDAILKVRNFKPSGSWTETDCGSSGFPGNGQSGRDWMRDSNENCQNP